MALLTARRSLHKAGGIGGGAGRRPAPSRTVWRHRDSLVTLKILTRNSSRTQRKTKKENKKQKKQT